jgi:hypothetical protein
VLLGPVTYLWLGKVKGEPFDRLSLLNAILPVYQHFIQQLGPGQFELLALHELRHHVVIVGVEPLGHFLGHKIKPVLLGPVTYLWLGKVKGEPFDRLSLLNARSV